MSCVKPKLLETWRRLKYNVEELNIPALEWAIRADKGGDVEFEFIGKYDALIALGCAQMHMLAVGKSGRKFGPG